MATPTIRARLDAPSARIRSLVPAPGYLLGRIGLLMVGTTALLIPGIVLLAIAVPLQAGATGAVRAIKMSASLTGGAKSQPGSGS